MYSNEPFFLSETQEESPPPTLANSPGVRDDNDNLGGFDLLASTERQATFLWQISGERFRDDEFLAEGVENYIKFLKLKPKAWKSRILLVPTYQIDLMWHTHILSSIGDYNKDCTAIMGRTLHHDDSFTDRSDGGVLDVAYKATIRLWKEEYDCNFVVCGGMYRGEPPEAFFSRDWKSSQDLCAGGNLHLVGLVGASSTQPLTTWTMPRESTSDGRPSFIPEDTTRKSQLSSRARKKDYVLGMTKTFGTGYYHMETKEAHEILLTRVERRIQELESRLAMKACCCPRSPALIQAEEAQLTAMKKVRDVLESRVKASSQGATVPGSTRDSTFYDDDGGWLYPPALFACAGGACGGGVVCGPSSCGGSACAGMFRHVTNKCTDFYLMTFILFSMWRMWRMWRMWGLWIIWKLM
jgi:hypothetical protein